MKHRGKISFAFTAALWLKTFPVVLLALTVSQQQLLGQVSENFSDGDFVASPPWQGDTDQFSVDAGRLRLTAPPATGDAFLATPSKSFYNAVWEFGIRLEFNPSSGNYARVYIASDQPDLSGPLSGYFVIIGDTPDEVSLYRQTGTSRVKIIDGVDGRVNLPVVDVRVRVTRDAAGKWELFSDVGQGFESEGTVQDIVHQSSSYFGLYCVYSATRSDKFFLDDVVVTGEVFIDLLPPDVVSVNVTSSTSLEVLFSEPVSPSTALEELNYLVPGVGSPVATAFGSDSATVALVFASLFTNGVSSLLLVSSVADTSGNVLSLAEKQFLYFESRQPARRDILFTEIFFDPTPVIGLPEVEFVEIYNRAEVPFNLEGWRFADAGDTVVLPFLILLPENYLVLCRHPSQSAYDSVDAIGVSGFPALNNSTDLTMLLDSSGAVIDSVRYSSSWYRDDEKEGGGFTLELINKEDFCSENLNWRASVSPAGGTPGKLNSVYDTTRDVTGPMFTALNIISTDSIEFFFDEKLQTPEPGSVSFQPTIPIAKIFPTSPSTFIVLLEESLDSVTTYSVILSEIFDCPGNPLRPVPPAVIKLDQVPPRIESVRVMSAHTLEVLFSEKMDPESVEDTSKYCTHSLGNPVDARLTDPRTVELVFADAFLNGVANTLETGIFRDLASNETSAAEFAFLFFEEVLPQRGDVIVTEIFPDPAPPLGMPEGEFIEIFNRSENPFQLSGWRITDGRDSARLSSMILLPGEYLVLCQTAKRTDFASFGNAMGLSGFPSLNNSADAVVLLTSTGVVVDSVSYEKSWYRDDVASDGGITLERINPDDFCRAELNWRASNAEAGGTPGQINSVYDATRDTIPPELIRVDIRSPDTIEFVFDEKLDHSLPGIHAVEFQPDLSVSHLYFASDASLGIVLSDGLDSATAYTMSVQNVRDCPGNVLEKTTPHVIKLDRVAPAVKGLRVQSAHTLEVEFTEALDSGPAEDFLHYRATNVGNPESAKLVNPNVVHLSFAQAFANGVNDTLIVYPVRDRALNEPDTTEIPFMFLEEKPVQWRDVIMTEIFADPAPRVGLPEAEFIEIYNRSGGPFDLKGWKITDGADTAILASRILLPGHYMILCQKSAAPAFGAFGVVMGLSGLPSLNNARDALTLMDESDMEVDHVAYDNNWYGDPEKKDGGWTLERVNPEDVCKGGANWKASVNAFGGTPGSENSVMDTAPDTRAPQLQLIKLLDSRRLLIQFDERLATNSRDVVRATTDPSIPIDSVAFADETLSGIVFFLEADIDSAFRYQIGIEEVFDCPGNRMSDTTVYFQLDRTPPSILSVTATSLFEIEILFSETVREETAHLGQNYFILNDKFPAEVVPVSALSVKLRFEEPFENGTTKVLEVQGVTDRAGNIIEPAAFTVLFFRETDPFFHCIRISEVMADPAPVVGLPETEYVEICNLSEDPFDLGGWTLSDESGSATLPSFILLPQEYLIMTRASAAAAFASFGNVVGVVGFPSLSNAGEKLRLAAPGGAIIDSVHYSTSWYNNSVKRDGGWSLEIINPFDVCKGALNWASSDDARGGTPGSRNSIHNELPDTVGPGFLGVTISDQYELVFNFSEKLHSQIAEGAFAFDPPIQFESVSLSNPELSSIKVRVTDAIDSSTTYTVTVSGIRDCPGNFMVGGDATATILLDTVPPYVVAVEVQDINAVAVTFSEEVDTLASNPITYEIVGRGRPDEVTLIGANKFRIAYGEGFQNGVEHFLAIQSVGDAAGNVMNPVSIPFMYFRELPVSEHDVIITEIFADPAPVVGLPETEFIEILNRSANPFDLSGWTLADETKETRLRPLMILPGEYVIICATNSAAGFHGYGKVLSIDDFPSLNNASDALVIKDKRGMVVDSVRYDVTWYRDNEKADGGWSLEIIDPENLCSERNNWTASEHEQGGTPGSKNSVFANKPDLTGPKLMTAFPLSDSLVTLSFDEKLDESPPPPGAFAFHPMLAVNAVSFTDQSLSSLYLQLEDRLSGGSAYGLTLSDVYDCAGNEIDPDFNSAMLALPEAAVENDLVINEVLFNPTSTGVDFVEVFNRSGKYVNLNGWKLGNASGDSIIRAEVVTVTNFLLPPLTYIVFTEDGNVLKGEYLSAREESFHEMDLPSLPDDEGSVVLLNDEGQRIDDLFYTEDLHSPFIRNPEGISLERISFEISSGERSNWKSASKAVGYATPGYLNSNASVYLVSEEDVWVEPEIFIPERGQPNFATIRYSFDRPNLIANVRILDARGREIKRIANNELLASTGFFRWDGDVENGMRANVGAYMVWMEVFDETGYVQAFRKRVVVASGF